MVAEILCELYFNGGYIEQIPRPALIKAIVFSTGRIDSGAANRLISSLKDTDILRSASEQDRSFTYGSMAWSILEIKKPEPEKPLEMPPAEEKIDIGTIDETGAPIESKIEDTRTPEEKMALLKKQYKVE